MITLTHLELEKVKKEGMEVFTQEQYNRFLEANMEVLQKGESNTLDELEKAEYEELKEEIKSFAEALVYSPSKESEFRIEKSICYIRPKQVEWDESELIKGENGTEIEKARSGRYTDTPLNRKMGRVGQKYGGEKKEEDESSGSFKIGDVVKFVKKNDKSDIINGKIVGIDENKVSFINTDYPNSGTSSFSKESLSKYYNVSKINSKESTEKKESK